MIFFYAQYELRNSESELFTCLICIEIYLLDFIIQKLVKLEKRKSASSLFRSQFSK